MKAIYLTGFMGAGKTTIGKALGEYLEMPVFDTDEEIEVKETLTISEIFEQQGEEFFRALETRILGELPVKDAVITTGGGIVCRGGNRQFIKEHGIVIFLFASKEEIVKRLELDETRPLLKGDKLEKIAVLYNERLPIYKQAADFTVDTTGKEIGEVVKEIVSCLKLQ
ncbi:shikimate kinase [Cytobacillus massiliigabonensis]|uniref:shikimate kinase n=1 Tax=Cytobacillus massiliigabonensis TaxID=1871011 RepID=UPI000C8678E4|nr:shikimate kinase [Cytobacillus massiliigabonensis]